jgi:hypothetical protein
MIVPSTIDEYINEHMQILQDMDKRNKEENITSGQNLYRNKKHIHIK